MDQDDLFLEVELTGATLHGDDPKTQYHTYKVQISRGMEQVWFKEYRFSQFEALRTSLMADSRFTEIVRTIEFPPKRYFGQLKPSTVAERKEKLGTWLSKLVVSPKVLSSPILGEFLGGAEGGAAAAAGKAAS